MLNIQDFHAPPSASQGTGPTITNRASKFRQTWLDEIEIWWPLGLGIVQILIVRGVSSLQGEAHEWLQYAGLGSVYLLLLWAFEAWRGIRAPASAIWRYLCVAAVIVVSITLFFVAPKPHWGGGALRWWLP